MMAMNDTLDEFKQFITATGLEAPSHIEPGRIIKFPGYQKGDRSKAAWCFMFDDLRGGVVGDYSTGMECTWQAGNSAAYTPAEHEANKQRINAIRAQRETNLQVTQHRASETAVALWSQGNPVPKHAYLYTKDVSSHGLKVYGEKLLIPMRDTAGQLQSLQTITPDGDKRFHPGGRVKGCYHSIGKPDGRIVVCEGYATAASIYESTGHATAAAFSAGGLMPVAMALHKKYPELTIVIAADDDWRTEGNPGLTYARSAALAVGGFVVVPQFPAGRPDKATDFNDLAAISGMDAVRACFSEIEVLSC